ncbi:MAG: hypothetical protein ACI9WU_000641 [Myxococcota bacterium]
MEELVKVHLVVLMVIVVGCSTDEPVAPVVADSVTKAGDAPVLTPDADFPNADGTLLPTDVAEPASDDGPGPTDEGPPPTDEGAPATDDLPRPTDQGPPPTDAGLVPTDQGAPQPPVCEAQWIDGRLVHGAAPPLVTVDPGCGLLSYGRYPNQGEAGDPTALLPDFSYAGYMGGGVAIPDVPVKVSISPVDGDDRAQIQAAIDEVSALPLDATGHRGAVLLAAGTYEVSDTVVIAVSGVVLRGAGQGTTGTVLVATAKTQHDLLRMQGAGTGWSLQSGTTVSITSSVAAVGARSFEVSDAALLSVGDTIAVRRTPNTAWIDALNMGQWGWTASAYAVNHERKITAIDGNTLTVDIPLVDTIDAQYGGGEVFVADLSGRIEQCGVEDLRLISEYDGDTDEEHGWNAIKLARTANSWVRRVTAVHFGYSAVTLHAESAFNTIEEVAQLDPISQVTGGRRYSFNVTDGIGNLFQRCYARDGRHNFVTGSKVTGPNVWLDSLSMKNNSDEGPHHRWATGLLFDSCMSGQFDAQNRTSSGTGHGWAGAQTLFWNIKATEAIRCDAPHAAMNWAVGSVGAKTEGAWAADEPFGYWESPGTPVLPRSLYLAQLSDRLGPDAVAAVTIPQQLDGTIWNQLNAWAGKKALVDTLEANPSTCAGIASGTTCCALSCGVCGGTGCGALPGGSSACCSGSIGEAGSSCATNPPPCVIP